MTSRSRSVVGIVLAAGRSQRMGEPKALLEIDGQTFLERAITTLLSGGCASVIVVLPPSESAQTMWEIAESTGARVVENPSPESEPIDSLRIGLDAASSDARAAAVLPVDHPVVRESTVAALLGAFESRGSIIVRPVFGDRPGHPIVLERSIWGELAEPDLPEGTRTVVRRHAAKIDHVAVDDPGVKANIDTPDDYEQELERRRCDA
jgi:CTP:molybdopterin cytidylyltransferase MocA